MSGEQVQDPGALPEVLALMKAIQDLLDLPSPASYEGIARHNELMVHRACEMRGVLKTALAQPCRIEITTRVIESISTDQPVTYRTEGRGE